MANLMNISHDLGRQLSRAELVQLTKDWAAQVDPKSFAGPHRWALLLHAGDGYEVVLEGWDDDHSTNFHNHGGSTGAMTVVSGGLHEDRIVGQSIGSERALAPGDTSAFGPTAIHNVTNNYDGPSLSVHAYSPPLLNMVYFNVDENGVVERSAELAERPVHDASEIGIE